jgi:hypothetical protein
MQTTPTLVTQSVGPAPEVGPLARYQRRVHLLLAEREGRGDAPATSLPTERTAPATSRPTERTAPARSPATAPVWLKPEPTASSAAAPPATAPPETPGGQPSPAASHPVSRYAADWAARLVRLAGQVSS